MLYTQHYCQHYQTLNGENLFQMYGFDSSTAEFMRLFHCMNGSSHFGGLGTTRPLTTAS